MAELQTLLSSLIYVSHNVRILHWNTGGLGFDPVHELLGSYYDELEGFVDEVAEIGKAIGSEPVTLFEALRIVTESNFSFMEIDSKNFYDTEDTFKALFELFNTLIEVYESVYTSNNIPPDVCNKLQEHCYFLRKNNRYKGIQRLKK